MAEIRQDPELAAELKADLVPFLTAAGKAGDFARDFDADSLAALAARGDWPALLEIAGSALEARLIGKGAE